MDLVFISIYVTTTRPSFSSSFSSIPSSLSLTTSLSDQGEIHIPGDGPRGGGRQSLGVVLDVELVHRVSDEAGRVELQVKVSAVELLESELRRGRGAELLHAVLDRVARDAEEVCHRRSGDEDLVCACCDLKSIVSMKNKERRRKGRKEGKYEESGGADAVRPPTREDPILLQPRYDAQRGGHDRVELLAQIESSRVSLKTWRSRGGERRGLDRTPPVYVERGVYDGKFQVQHGGELHEGLSEHEDVYLQRVREVDQEMRRLLLSTY